MALHEHKEVLAQARQRRMSIDFMEIAALMFWKEKIGWKGSSMKA
jgi:hypothetical protein